MADFNPLQLRQLTRVSLLRRDRAERELAFRISEVSRCVARVSSAEHVHRHSHGVRALRAADFRADPGDFQARISWEAAAGRLTDAAVQLDAQRKELAATQALLAAVRADFYRADGQCQQLDVLERQQRRAIAERNESQEADERPTCVRLPGYREGQG